MAIAPDGGCLSVSANRLDAEVPDVPAPRPLNCQELMRQIAAGRGLFPLPLPLDAGV